MSVTNQPGANPVDIEDWHRLHCGAPAKWTRNAEQENELSHMTFAEMCKRNDLDPRLTAAALSAALET